MRVRFLDLKAQYATIKGEIIRTMNDVCESQLKRHLNSMDWIS